MVKPVHVCITGGAGQIAYSLIPYVCQGYVFGDEQPVVLHLLDIPVEPVQKALAGVVLEIEDLAYPLVAGVIGTDSLEEAFKDCDYAIFLGAFPRKKGMERKDLLEKNVGIFKNQGAALAQHAKNTCKIVVVGNPANTNCLTLMANAPAIPKENFSALTRLDHNRAKAALAIQSAVPVDQVDDTFIWGNHSSTQYPDLHHAKIRGVPTTVHQDYEWYNNEFIPKIQKRGAAIIAARGLSSAASAAKATADHMKDWTLGTAGKSVSMAVISDGNSYDIPEGLIYSFPVICTAGKWSIINGLSINEFSRVKMQATADELAEEKHEAEEIIKNHTAKK